jgi:hypothetical protein
MLKKLQKPLVRAINNQNLNNVDFRRSGNKLFTVDFNQAGIKDSKANQQIRPIYFKAFLTGCITIGIRNQSSRHLLPRNIVKQIKIAQRRKLGL